MGFASDRAREDRYEGYQEGYADGYASAMRNMSQGFIPGVASTKPGAMSRRKPKRKQTGKAKILTDMARPIWNKYKKGNGKKTYFDIRSEVRRSQAYRRKVKDL